VTPTRHAATGFLTAALLTGLAIWAAGRAPAWWPAALTAELAALALLLAAQARRAHRTRRRGRWLRTCFHGPNNPKGTP
jgi:hypothetical protein